MADPLVAHGIREICTVFFHLLQGLSDDVDADMIETSSKNSCNFLGDVEPMGCRDIGCESKCTSSCFYLNTSKDVGEG